MQQTKQPARTPGDRRLLMSREVLLSATAGKVRLCLDASELPDPPERAGPSFKLGSESLPEFRRGVYKFTSAQRLPAERRQHLLTAAGEAAMNAVVHGGGGEATLATDGHGTVQVRITDGGLDTGRPVGERDSTGYGW